MDVGRGTAAARSVRELVQGSGSAASRRLTRRELRVEAALAGAFLAFAVLLAARSRGANAVDVALLVGLYALLSRIRAYIGPGAGVPSQLALVPMLALLPPGLVPLAVAAGLLLGSLADVVRRAEHPERLLSAVGDACYALGPVALLLAMGGGSPQAGDYPVWLALLGAQLAADVAASMAREWFGRGVPRSLQLRTVLAVSGFDLLLTPIGLLAVAASQTIAHAYVMVVPLGLLLALLTQDRQLRIEESAVRLAELEQERALLADAIHRATTDALTALANRRQFEDVLGREIALSHRYGTPVALVVLDIDTFKTINDTHGHLVGDLVLRTVAAALRRGSRVADLAARYGGDELVLVVTRATRDTALAVAESIRSSIAALEIDLPGDAEPLRVTASLGVAACPADAGDSEALVAAADAALYRAKRAGRNRVAAAGAQPFQPPAGRRLSGARST